MGKTEGGTNRYRASQLPADRGPLLCRNEEHAKNPSWHQDCLATTGTRSQKTNPRYFPEELAWVSRLQIQIDREAPVRRDAEPPRQLLISRTTYNRREPRAKRFPLPPESSYNLHVSQFIRHDALSPLVSTPGVEPGPHD